MKNLKKLTSKNTTILTKKQLTKIVGGTDSEPLTIGNATHDNRWPKA
ncbi:hypothetical protein T190115A13A_70096 [Tenacibaculum sp. 190524A02b]|uniref:Bacteriocin n=1 Tax=Tenacibaculum vairaonense TaxID=3137860 RepID=A0ABP1FD73_9FLAO